MGAIGERKLQELIDKAAADVARGTPPDVASRGLFEACAEMFEGHEDAEHRAEEAETGVDDYEKAVEDLRTNVKDLLDEDIGYGDPEPGDILDAYKALAGEIDELRASAKTKDARIEELEDLLEKADDMRTALQGRANSAEERITNLQQTLEAAEARLRELEPAGEERAALVERVRYLESGLGRLVVEAYKLRKGAL